MFQTTLPSLEDIFIHEGLSALYKHGWGRDICYQEAAKLFDGLPKEYEATYRNVEQVLRENVHIDRCVRFMVDASSPSAKAGFFEINDRLANPVDGHSLKALEAVYRTHLILTGEMESLNFNLTHAIDQVLTVDNAQSFFSDWVNAKEDQMVTIRGAGNQMPLYFKAPYEKGVLPELHTRATIDAVAIEHPDKELADVVESIEALNSLLESPKAAIENHLSLRQEWSKVVNLPRRQSQEVAQGL